MNLKFLIVLAGAALALCACNNQTVPRGGNAAVECTKFGATVFADGTGISTTRSNDDSAVTVLFEGLRAWTFAGHDDQDDDATLGLSVVPDGCESEVTVGVRGYCQAADASAQPTIGIKWAGQEWTGTPECPADGGGYLLETKLDAAASADSTFTARVSVAKNSRAQLTIDAVDLALKR